MLDWATVHSAYGTRLSRPGSPLDGMMTGRSATALQASLNASGAHIPRFPRPCVPPRGTSRWQMAGMRPMLLLRLQAVSRIDKRRQRHALMVRLSPRRGDEGMCPTCRAVPDQPSQRRLPPS